MAQSWPVNPNFHPEAQPVTLLGPDGVTPVEVSVAKLVAFQHNAVNTCINQGLQTGAALILLVTLLLITSKEKRRSTVFLFNASALLFVILRGVMTFCIVTGPLYNFYNWAVVYYPDVQGAQNISTAGEIISFMLIITIEVSLAMQVRIVCCDLATWQNLGVNIINGLVAFAVCGLRFALMVINITWNIQGLKHETAGQFHMISKLASAVNIVFVSSIGVSTLLFCTKLGFAIESRRSMGMNQFGPMQIIFVIGCQTMCTPLIFTIVAYWGVKNAQLSSVATTIVALSLPLSAMWATANTNNRHLAANNNLRNQIPVGGSGLAKATKGSYYTDTTDTNGTLVGDSPGKEAFERDLEMQQLSGRGGANGVQVHRAYTVRTD